jgi:2-oxoglutarate dehydrogenase E2 component (dihydrolipoamide succinyltransferase)
MTDILVPSLGESVSEASVAKWRKRVGDAVAKDETLVELETDKVSLEVSATEDGVLTEILAAEGESVGIGALLGRTGGAAEAKAQSKQAAPKPAPEPALSAPPPPPPITPVQPAAAIAAAAPVSGGSMLDVVIPQMGESVSEGTLGRWLKKPGDTVKAAEAIAEIETDKVAVEVPAPAAGVLVEALIPEGETVAVGTVIARIEAGATAAKPAATSPPVAPPPAAPQPAQPARGAPPPSVERIAAEAGLNPGAIPASGPKGNPTKADALAAAAAAASAVPAVVQPASQAVGTPRALKDGEERVRMSRLRQTIARRLKEAQSSAAMLTTFNEADMSAIMAVRAKYKDLFEKKHGVKLGFMSFFVKACVHALKDIPAVNAEIEGTDIIYKNYYDIGIAVGTDRGLVVPVLRDADGKSLGGIEAEIGALGVKARDGQLSIDDLQGATFTISNGGVYGSLMSTPILNAPQSGILGMHKIQDRPVAVNGQVVIRPMMYLALSYDHRIVDGKEAVTFLVRVKELLEDPERLVLDL